MPNGIDGINGDRGFPQTHREGAPGNSPSEEPAQIDDVPRMTGDFHVGASEIYGHSQAILRERREAWKRSEATPGLSEKFAAMVLKIFSSPTLTHGTWKSFLLRVIDRIRGGRGSPPTTSVGGSGTPSSAPSAPPSTDTSTLPVQHTQSPGFSSLLYPNAMGSQFMSPALFSQPCFRLVPVGLPPIDFMNCSLFMWPSRTIF